MDPKFLQAIAEAQKRKAMMAQQAATGETAKEEVDPEVASQRRQAAQGYERYAQLAKKMQDPRAKRDILDVLEFQHIREKQVEY